VVSGAAVLVAVSKFTLRRATCIFAFLPEELGWTCLLNLLGSRLAGTLVADLHIFIVSCHVDICAETINYLKLDII
jgi:hypothetical protein